MAGEDARRPAAEGAAEQEAAEQAPAPPPPAPPVDAWSERLAARAGRQSPRSLPRTLAGAWRMTRQAGPGELALMAALSVGGALMALGQVLLTQRALGELLRGDRAGDVGDAVLPLAALVALTGLLGVVTAFQSQRQRYLAELVARRVFDRLLDVTTTVPLEVFDRPGFYDQLQRVQANATSRPVAVVQGMLGVLAAGLTSVVLVGALVAVQPLLVVVLVLAAAPLSVLQRRGARIEYAFALAQTPGLRQRLALSDLLTGREPAAEVRAFGSAPVLRERHDALYDDYLRALRTKVGRRVRLAVLAAVATAVVVGASVGLLLLLVDRGSVSLADAGAAVVAILLLSRRLGALSSGGGSILEGGLFLDDLDRFLAAAPERAPVPDVAARPVAFEALRLEGLGYTYPGSTAPAVAGVSLELRRGEVLALVGENGSGKTTLSKLLARLYEPDEGRLLWDGRDVRELDADALREGTTVLFQDFVRYELPLVDNIALGAPGRSDAEAVERAAALAGADAVAARLPQGWQTFLSPRFPGGTDLSGGQWQRVAMARALVRDAPFVILDEPTAALDPKAEAALFVTLRQLLQGRTTVLVTHRFSSARAADRIAVMAGGRLVELGTHDELMAARGLYEELFSVQAAGYLGDPVTRPRRARTATGEGRAAPRARRART